MTNEPTSAALDERLRAALLECETALDDADTDYVVEAVLPLMREYATEEYSRGVEYGDYTSRRDVAHPSRPRRDRGS